MVRFRAPGEAAAVGRKRPLHLVPFLASLALGRARRPPLRPLVLRDCGELRVVAVVVARSLGDVVFFLCVAVQEFLLVFSWVRA